MLRNKLIVLLWLLGTTAVGAQKEDTGVLVVPAIEFKGNASLSTVSDLLEAQTELQHIAVLNWEAFPYQPDVTFRIAHCNNEIWLKYYIQEEHVLATRTTTNSATHRDSCLEFFLDPKEDGNYYNFEVNAIGTTHLAYGPGRKERTFIEPQLIEHLIEVRSSLGREPFVEKTGKQSWELTLVIPASILVHDEGIRLAGLRARANFYKCGDDSSVPHFLSWNPVTTDRPDFHTPQFFGMLIFE
jgi:hypothetical protein